MERKLTHNQTFVRATSLASIKRSGLCQTKVESNCCSPLVRGMRGCGLATPWIQKPSSLLPRLPYLCWDIFLTVLVIFMLAIYTYTLMTIKLPFQDLCGLGISATNYLIGFLVTFYHAFYGRRIKKITDDMDTIAKTIRRNELGQSELYHELYQKNSKLMSSFTTVSIGFAAFLPFTYLLSPAISDGISGNYRARYPVMINSPFEDHKPVVFELMVSTMSVCISSSVTKKTATDCLFITLFRMQADLLKYLSITLASMRGEFLSGDRVLLKKKLAVWVRLHQDIEKNIQELIQMFSPVIIIYYVSLIGNVVCAAFIQIKKDNDSIFQSVCMFVYIIVALTYLFLLSNTAAQLTTETENLSLVAYDTPWFEVEKSTADVVRLVITIANRPIDVTAYRAPVFLLNRETFAGFIATALSAFITFCQMKDMFDEDE